jgi:hypothetical protein
MVDAHTDDDFPHEHEFTADVVSWMMLIIDKDPSLPFAAAKFDRRSKGSQQRRDLSLAGADGRILVTGEIKLPYQKDGATPYNASVVSDARQKAARAGADYFFTWNVNECVLWKTETPADDPTAGQYYQSWKVVSVAKEEHLVLPSTKDEIKSWLGRFLNELGRIVRGRAHVGFKSPDERFVESLESALSLPIRLTFEELEKRYRTARGQSDLDAWMRDEQGWTLAADPIGITDTRAEVVDLINSFSIRTGTELVIDPACGGGTFLVRAASTSNGAIACLLRTESRGCEQ